MCAIYILIKSITYINKPTKIKKEEREIQSLGRRGLVIGNSREVCLSTVTNHRGKDCTSNPKINFMHLDRTNHSDLSERHLNYLNKVKEQKMRTVAGKPLSKTDQPNHSRDEEFDPV